MFPDVTDVLPLVKQLVHKSDYITSSHGSCVNLSNLGFTLEHSLHVRHTALFRNTYNRFDSLSGGSVSVVFLF